MGIKGDWNRVEDRKAWDDNYDNIFKKKLEEVLEEHKDAMKRLKESEDKDKKDAERKKRIEEETQEELKNKYKDSDNVSKR